jgi:hypothetical protein
VSDLVEASVSRGDEVPVKSRAVVVIGTEEDWGRDEDDYGRDLYCGAAATGCGAVAWS